MDWQLCHLDNPKVANCVRWENVRFCDLSARKRTGGDPPGAADLTVSDLRDALAPPIKTPSDGTLMLKYVPRTGAWGEAKLHQADTHASGRSRQHHRMPPGEG